MRIEWNEEKNRHLQKTRGISFEVIEELICDGSVIPEPHPNQERYSGQIILIRQYESYLWVCPAIELDNGFFLKTIFPSSENKKEMDDE
ncbi:MAG: toxin [Spirochaetaceae bacterium]|nr:toxin [Spirochaetaceae bacterium]